jgi:hypothetical protein
MRSPRKTKKAADKALIVMDLVSIPDYWDISKWMEITKLTGRVFWDSKNGGQEPRLLSRKNKRIKFIKEK